MLQSVETRIEDIQVRLLSMIDEDDILVGHSLENDLRALRMVHDKIIDTAVLFRGANGRKFSLKHLSNVLLQRKIQCGTLGHCSTEDAEAALALALRRARRGDSFQLKENSSRQNIFSTFQKINRESNGQGYDAEVFAERNDRSCVCIGK
jgi:RNA exonuclease 1